LFGSAVVLWGIARTEYFFGDLPVPMMAMRTLIQL